MAYNAVLIAVIPIGNANAANVVVGEAQAFGGSGLVPSASAPGTAPTYTWCSWRMSDVDYAAKKSALESASLSAQVFDGNVTGSDVVLSSLSLKPFEPLVNK